MKLINGGVGAALLRLDAGADGEDGAAVGEVSVERLAASAVSGGVAEGWVGGGWRPATGLRDAQPQTE